jgi:hypothetical protein
MAHTAKKGRKKTLVTVPSPLGQWVWLNRFQNSPLTRKKKVPSTPKGAENIFVTALQVT